ncbi:class I SAM-dependent methyltransferase [Anaerorhabdus sp.]|uniref:class I SAM-dependent methyltransferase n=1 Tax=Anaerorhabdus sp. TaxID=1872524 RepID=UPI002FCBEEDB
MLDNKGFDLWSKNYDKSVNLLEENDKYPFAGYRDLLGMIYSKIRCGQGKKVLDIGIGTGVLAKRLYYDGYEITGIDFSRNMLTVVKEKMPNAFLVEHDFSQGYPEQLAKEKFDAIVCTYAIHHLDDDQKVIFINELQNHLNENGSIYIGDVAFERVDECEQCKIENAEYWDYDEIYPVLETLASRVKNISFLRISHCAGIFIIGK